MPKYYWGKTERINGRFLDPLEREFECKKIKYKIEIAPAVITDRDGVKRDYLFGVNKAFSNSHIDYKSINESIWNWLISICSKSNTAKAKRGAIQIPCAVSKDSDICFAIAIVISRCRCISYCSELNAGKS